MSSVRFVVFTLILAALVLSACNLSASTPPAVQTTDPGPLSTLQSELGAIYTQTAMASGATGGETQPAPTQDGGQVQPTSVVDTPVQPTVAPATQEPTQAPEPTATFVPVPTATPGIPLTYELQKGEYPFCIARRFNVDVGELLSVNGLGSNSLIPEGYEMTIPQTGNTFTGQRALIEHPTTYEVEPGETIYTIACAFGDADPNLIILANGLEEPYELSSGQTLYIP